MVLFLMPESREFRNWYPPEAQPRLMDYLTSLSRTYNAPLIDARRWIEDDAFSDGHHLLSWGAAAFTRLFSNEVRSLVKQRTPRTERDKK